MRFNKLALSFGFSILAAGAASANTIPWSGPITVVDGKTGPQYTGPGSSDTRMNFRPMNPTQTVVNLSNIEMQNVTNQKAISIAASINSDNSVWAFNTISVTNYVDNNQIRTIPGLHIDGIHITGGGDRPAPKTNVTLTNILIENGSSLPINIQDGNFGTIILNNVDIENMDLNQVQMACINSGHIDHVIIENSPGLHVALMGKPGSIGDVEVINSPGATATDVLAATGLSGVKVTYANSAAAVTGLKGTTGSTTTTTSTTSSGVSSTSGTAHTTAVPEPSSLGVFALAGIFFARRRKTA